MLDSKAMRLLSSDTTFFFKRVFPALWFGFLGIFMVTGFSAAKTKEGAAFLLIPVFMAGFGYFIMKHLVFDLVDTVSDDGDALVVRKGGREERVALTNIINVSHTTFTNPPRITLMLREPGTFGKEITFAPPSRFPSFKAHPIAVELIERIDEKRRRG